MNEEYNNNMDSLSLDNRQSQLNLKIEQMTAEESEASVSVQNAAAESPDVIIGQNDSADEPSDRNEVHAAEMPRVNIDKPVMPVPQMNVDNPAAQMNRSATAVQIPTQGISAANPYVGNVSINDFTGGMKPPKRKFSGGLKVYLTVIIGLCIIFVGMFAYECYRAYEENGLFGGGLNKLLENDFDFDDPYGFDFDSDYPFLNSDSDSEGDDDSDTSEPSQDTSEAVDSDVVKERKPAPSDEGLLTEDADKLEAKDQPKDIDSANYSARTAFKKVENSVVNIVTYKTTVGDENDKTGSGSGIILTADGYIATNSHVVDDSKNTPTEVVLNNGDSYIASIVGVDVRTDIAVLKIDANDLIPVEFVNSDQIEVGQDAIAVGSPGGVKYSNSLTRGCVSALNRTVKSNALVPYIQTDAAINPGNSGGPLLNSAGQVMGINTIKIANSDYEGMGFAIPSNTVLSIIKDIMKHGYVTGRVRIGISGVTVSSLTAPAGSPSGVVIKGITDDSPLINTEVQVEDIITAVNGVKIDGMPALFSELGKYQPGDEITLSCSRLAQSSTRSQNFEVKIVLMPDNGETQD